MSATVGGEIETEVDGDGAGVGSQGRHGGAVARDGAVAGKSERGAQRRTGAAV